jgi:hypothetical protein
MVSKTCKTIPKVVRDKEKLSFVHISQSQSNVFKSPLNLIFVT